MLLLLLPLLVPVLLALWATAGITAARLLLVLIASFPFGINKVSLCTTAAAISTGTAAATEISAVRLPITATVAQKFEAFLFPVPCQCVPPCGIDTGRSPISRAGVVSHDLLVRDSDA